MSAGAKKEIGIFPNRISIDNPGAFPDDLNPEDFVEHTVASRLRNESICDILYKYGCVETWGTGLAKAYSLCFEAGIRCGCEKGGGFWFIFHRNSIGSRTRSTPTLTNLIKRKQ